MARHVDAVNTEAAPLRYHHGRLREALVDAGVDLARAGGPEAIVLREAARRVGVSATAAYRHFADRDALLDAVGEAGAGQLAGRMRAGAVAAADAGPIEAAVANYRATGAAYVHFALDEPGLFRTAFARAARHGPTAHGHPPDAVVDNPSTLLRGALDELVHVGALAPEARPLADEVSWAAVHGLAVLLLEGALPEGLAEGVRAGEPGNVLDRLLDTVWAGVGAAPESAGTAGRAAPEG